MPDQNTWDTLKSDTAMTFTPETARAVCRQCNAARDSVAQLVTDASLLTKAGNAGSFISATSIQNALQDLAQVLIDGITRLQGQFSDVAAAVRAAGLRITDQDADNARALASTTDCARGYDDLVVEDGGHTMYSYPEPFDGDPAVTGGTASEAFPNTWQYELLAADMIAKGYQAMNGADTPSLFVLAQRWTALARNLNAVITKFDKETQKLLSDGTWTGTAQEKIKPALADFASSAQKMAEQTFQNSQQVWKWHELVSNSKTQFRTLNDQLTTLQQQQLVQASVTPLAPAAIAAQQAAVQRLQQQARDYMSGRWNPSTMQISQFGLRAIPDPQSPVGAPLPVPGAAPARPAATLTPASRPTPTGSGPGPGGPSGGTSSSTKPGATKLTGPAPTPGPTQGGKGTPVPTTPPATGAPTPQMTGKSAAGAGSTAGLPGAGNAAARSAATRSAAANAMKLAEKSAAARAAASKMGGGGGGGGLGGGAAAAEKALAARAGSMGQAERMAAAEQAALQQSRAGTPGTPGAAGAPMGGRGAGSGSEDKAHKAARYLQSKENGEEIIGDQGEAAPAVVGGLNLDTSGDKAPVEARIPR
ncbi:hypothetical protein [Williamsia sp. CHRR-6]|uniref:hypothetical protein n=1 Tax=Williamsia sp. CHRR-6 TaxID=2835871 RepID=UPI001BDA7267|nr:hypothetical protein [Williamsia sp. CHRR-6]MBT0568489.1 hypothetical protein [Williamsia sp. CHRR-6]